MTDYHVQLDENILRVAELSAERRGITDRINNLICESPAVQLYLELNGMLKENSESLENLTFDEVKRELVTCSELEIKERNRAKIAEMRAKYTNPEYLRNLTTMVTTII